MKISAIGESRKVYTHTIFDRELKQTRWPMPNKQNWHVNKDTEAITFSWDKWSLDMHGSYQFSAQISREEIVRLFVSSMSNVPLEEVVQLLAESGKKPATGARVANVPTSTKAAAA
jgi:hypothetical protein